MLSQEILRNGLILWNYHCRIDRLELAPQRGFQIPQELPADVMQAFEALYQAGFVQHSQ